jgi:HEAT repeat protein
MTEPTAQDVQRFIQRATGDRTKPAEETEQAKAEFAEFANKHPDLVISVLAEDPYKLTPFRDMVIDLLTKISEPTYANLRDTVCDYVCTFGRGWSPRIIYAYLYILQKMKAPEVLEPLLDRVAHDLPSQSRSQLQYFASTFKAIDAKKAVEILITRLLDQSEETTWIARGQIAEVLGYMRDEAAIEPLQAVLESVNKADENDKAVAYCRQYTEGALKQLGV